MSSPTISEPGYGIRAVSQLTGIALETLRAWERRYAVVEPQRGEGNQRLYSPSDVVRLQLIKQLVDYGHAISTVADLDETTLRARLNLHTGTPNVTASRAEPARVLVYGDSLPFLIKHWRSDLGMVNVIGTSESFDEFERAAIELQPDILLMELAALDPAAPIRLPHLWRQAGADQMVVVYGFAPERVVERLQQEGVITLRGPVTSQRLREACGHMNRRGPIVSNTAMAKESAAAAPTPRRFNGEMLAAMANLPTRIRCECPHHLADLLFRLSAFETYSAQCESMNPRDAAVHAHLHRSAAQARSILEESLEYLITCEDIDLSVYS